MRKGAGMKVIGSKTHKREKVRSFGPMGRFTRAATKLGSSMGTVSTSGPMTASTMDSGTQIKYLEKGCTDGLTDAISKARGKTMICMEKESTSIQMAVSIRETILKITVTGTVSLHILMGVSTKECGKTESNMVWELSSSPQASSEMVSGRMASEYAGKIIRAIHQDFHRDHSSPSSLW